MTVYITGDIHGCPVLREWPQKHQADAVIIAGDFGIPFGVLSPDHTIEDMQRELRYAHFLNNLGYPIYAMCGNHDDRDAYGAMDSIYLGNYPVRQFVMYGEYFDNIYIIDRPWAGEIAGQKFFLIPGAASHDLWHTPANPSDPEDMERYYLYRSRFESVRCNHRSWWENEDVDYTGVKLVLATMSFTPDVIVSHDAPSHISLNYNKEYDLPFDATTAGQRILEGVYRKFPQIPWIHGHYHKDSFEDWGDEEVSQMRCVCDDFAYVENDEIFARYY